MDIRVTYSKNAISRILPIHVESRPLLEQFRIESKKPYALIGFGDYEIVTNYDHTDLEIVRKNALMPVFFEYSIEGVQRRTMTLHSDPNMCIFTSATYTDGKFSNNYIVKFSEDDYLNYIDENQDGIWDTMIAKERGVMKKFTFQRDEKRWIAIDEEASPGAADTDFEPDLRENGSRAVSEIQDLLDTVYERQ